VKNKYFKNVGLKGHKIVTHMSRSGPEWRCDCMAGRMTCSIVSHINLSAAAFRLC
jgi:hypothetical protein